MVLIVRRPRRGVKIHKDIDILTNFGIITATTMIS